MRGKVFILAVVVCVSFVQVRGDPELEQAIKKGLERLVEIVQSGEKELTKFKDFATKQTEEATARFQGIETAAKASVDEALGAVKSVADAARAKAEESRLPESAGQCISKFESYAVGNINALFEELRKQGANHLRLSQNNIQSFRDVLAKRENYLAGETKVADNKIRGSKDAKSIDYAVSAFETQVCKLREDISWILWQIKDISYDCERQINSSYSEFKLTLANIKCNASRDIRLCVIDTNAIIKRLLNIKQ